MHRFIFKRLGMLIPVLMGVMVIIFTLNYITPGDPARIALGEQAHEDDIAALRTQMGLDDPFAVRLVWFFADTVRFDFGNSLLTGRSVLDEIWARFPTTIHLAVTSTVLAVLMGIPLGIICAVKQYSIFDNVATVIGLAGVSMPSFWQALVLVLVFSLNLRWLPATGYDTPLHWILPAITVGTSSAAIIMRMTRSTMLEVIRQDYIRTAKAKGQGDLKIIYKHALKNAIIPVITVIGLQVGFVLGGAVLVETIFAIPGLGRFVVEAISRRDYPVIQGAVILFALTFALVNMLVDIIYAFFDPRIRSQYVKR
jgi:peptide/nickel transport system permease protein